MRSGLHAEETVMELPSSFADLMKRVRAGDADAATDLVKQYEPAIRRSLRLRLDPRLRRTCDSLDICQAVLGSFFVRAAAGQYDLDTPEQLLKLLVTMTRHKLTKTRRDQYRARRDIRRIEISTHEHPVEGRATTPSVQAAARELLAELRSRLTDDERRIVELRNHGHDWAHIATEVGGTAEGVRKKFSRAVSRVADDLGLDEADLA
jgi:RNA polymerase sigma-70 factor (ECF subfamily)